MDVDPSGRYLVATSEHDVAIWQREKGWLLRTLTGHRSEVHAVAFSPDGTLVASGTDDGELALWRVADGRRIWNKTQADSHIAGVRFTRDGSIMTVSWDNTIRLWNEAGCATSCIIARTTGSPASLALSPDERWIAAGDTSNRVSVWRLAADRLSASPHESLTLPGGDRSSVRGISIDRQGRLVAVNFAGQVVHQQLEPWSTLWTKETGLRLDGVATTPDGLRVCVVGNEAPLVGRAVCFRTQDGERVPLNELFAGACSFRATPFGRWLSRRMGAG